MGLVKVEDLPVDVAERLVIWRVQQPAPANASLPVATARRGIGAAGPFFSARSVNTVPDGAYVTT